MANKIGVVLALDGEKEFKAALQASKAEASALKSELAALQAEYDGNANSLQALVAKQEVLQRAQKNYASAVETAKAGQKAANKLYQEHAQALQKLEGALEEAKKAQDKFSDDKESEGYKEATKAVEDLEKAVSEESIAKSKSAAKLSEWNKKVTDSQTALSKTNTELTKNEQYMDEAKRSADGCAKSIDKFGKEVKEADKEVEELGKDSKTASGGLKEFVKNAASFAAGKIMADTMSRVGDAAKQAAQYVVEVGSEFEASMDKVAAISGATTSEIDQISDKARELGASTRFSASEVADGFSYMSLAGWSTQQMLDGIDGVLNLAAASEMDLAQASDMVTDNLSAFGMAASESAHLADMMASAQANSNTSAQQLGEAYGNCATKLHTAGQSAETVTAILEGMANVGDKGASAGTTLAAVMAQITANMKDGAIAIGDTSVRVTDAEGNFRNLIDIFADIEAAVDGLGSADMSAALSKTFNRTSMAGVTEILTAGVDSIKDYEDQLKSCDGTAADMAQTMQGNLKGALTELGSATEGLGITVYDYVQGPIAGAVELLTGAVSALNDILTPTSDTVSDYITAAETALNLANSASGQASAAMTEAEQQAATIGLLGENLLGYQEKVLAGEEVNETLLASTVKAIGQYIPEITDAFDEQNGVLMMSIGQISAYVAQAQGATKLSGATAALNAYADAEQAVLNNSGTTSDTVDILEQRASFLEGLAPMIAGITTQIDDMNLTTISTDSWDQLHDAIEQANAQGIISGPVYESLSKALDDVRYSADPIGELLGVQEALLTQTTNSLHTASGSAEELAGAEDGLTDSITEQQGAVADLEVEQAALDQAVEDANAAAKEDTATQEALARATGKTGEATSAAADLMGELADSEEDAADSGEELIGVLTAIEDAEKNAAANSEAGATAQKNAVDSVRDAYTTFRNQLESDIQNKISLFDTFDGGEDMTIEEIVGNLGKTQEALTTWRSNMQYLADQVGDTITPAFYAAMLEMGTEGANLAQHMVTTLETQGEEGRQLIIDMCQTWGENMDMSEPIAESMANTRAVLYAELQELGSTEADFTALKESISSAFDSGNSGWLGLDDAMKAELNTAIANAEKIGAKIPEGLAESIASGKTSYDSALQQIQGATQGYMEGTLEVFEDAGVKIPQTVADAIEAGGDEAVTAFSDMMESLASTDAADSSAGTELTDKMANDITAGSGNVVDATTQVVSDAVDAASGAEIDASGFDEQLASGITEGADSVNSAATEVVNGAVEAAQSGASAVIQVGQAFSNDLASGIMSGSAAVSSAAASVASSAYNSLSANSGNFYSVGLMAAQGYANGISSGSNAAVNAAINMAVSAINAAKSAQDSHSPSKEFEKLGIFSAEGYALGMIEKYSLVVGAATTMVSGALEVTKQFTKDLGKKVGNGLTFGLKVGAKASDKQAASISANILKKATSWIKAYKKKHDVTAQDEVYFWQKIVKATKTGTSAYKKAVSSLSKATIKAFQDTGMTKKQADDAAKNIKKLFDVSQYSVDKKGKKTKKDTETYYSEIYSAAEKYSKNKQILNDWSLQSELLYWNNVLSKLKKGTQAWYDAQNTINGIKSDIAKAEQDAISAKASGQSTIIDYYKAYYKDKKGWDMSLRAEMQYWDAARKQLAEGTEERIEADMKYLDAKSAYYEELESMEADYAENVKDINDRMKDQIDELTGAYKDAVSERESTILSSMSLFEAWDSKGYGMDTLLHNLETQVAGLAIWEQKLEELKQRGISTDLYEYLAEQGPDAAANIYSLAAATDEQLKKYQELFDTRADLARQQAIKDNESLYNQTQSQISGVRADAQKELDELNANYRDALTKITTSIDSSLLTKMEQAGEKSVEALFKSMSSKLASDSGDYTTQLTNSIEYMIEAATVGMEETGGVALDKILEGMYDPIKIESSANEVVESITSAFRDLTNDDGQSYWESIGTSIADGIGTGLVDGTTKAVASVQQMLNSSMIAVGDMSASGNLSIDGLAALNNLASAAPSASVPIVNVNNSGQTEMLSTMLGAMNTIINIMASGIALDDGTIVARYQELFSQRSAELSTIRNRGSL